MNHFGLPLLFGPFFDDDEEVASGTSAKAYCVAFDLRDCGCDRWLENRGANVILSGGNGADLVATWTDSAGEEATPTAVQYQVFDYRTRESVSGVVDVETALAASMVIHIQAADIPGNTSNRRRLVIQVTGTFDQGSHTGLVHLYIQKRFS